MNIRRRPRRPYTRVLQAMWRYGTPGQITLTYNPADPYAVSLAIPGIEDDTGWLFERDLLAAGLDAPWRDPAGDVAGGIRIWSTEQNLGIRLTSPVGVTAEFILNRCEVAVFLAVTAVAVPFGREHIGEQLDKWLHKVLGGAK